MAIITLDEVKDILRIDGDSYDNDIDRLIPYVQDDVVTYCNNHFQDKYVYRESGSYISFVRGTTGSSGDVIKDSDSKFIQKGFLSDMDIAVEGGGANVGIHHVTSAAAGQLTLDSTGEIISQDPDDTGDNNWIGEIKISRVKWPPAIKLPVAQMIHYLIEHPHPSDIRSESIDDYSVTYVGSNAYPDRIAQGLKPFRRAVVI
jgi:hypothetical protein